MQEKAQVASSPSKTRDFLQYALFAVSAIQSRRTSAVTQAMVAWRWVEREADMARGQVGGDCCRVGRKKCSSLPQVDSVAAMMTTYPNGGETRLLATVSW